MALQGVKGLYQKRGWFYFQSPTPDDGSPRPKPVALKTQDLVKAIESLADLKLEVSQERAAVSGTLKEILPRYYAAKREDSKATRRCREAVLNSFMEDMGNPRAETLTTAMIEAWRDSLMTRTNRAGKYKQGKGSGKPLSGTTIKTYTITLRAFINWLKEEGVLRHDPMAKLKRQTRVAVTKRHDFLTEPERETLLAAKCSDEVKLILHLGFFAGMRDGEMLAMNPGWVWTSEDGSRGTITVQETRIELTDGTVGLWKPKTRELRTIPMHPRLITFLKEYGLRSPWLLAPQNDKWPVDTKKSKRYDAKTALRGLVKRTGVRKLNFHILRHSFATHLAMKGVPMAEIAGLLGDSIRVTEDHYAGFCPNQVNPLAVL